jgi:hypothetical protein
MTELSIHEVDKDDDSDSPAIGLKESELSQIRLVCDQWL